MISNPTTAIKDPDAVKDYKFDCSLWLDSDTIASHSVTVPAGITLDSSANDSTSVTAWLSGGTAGSSYRITCRVVTAGGRTDDVTVTIMVLEQ